MKQHKILEIRNLTDSTFVVRMKRLGLNFQNGTLVKNGLKGGIEQREYSIYSGENDNFLEILVREVNQGKVSGKLKTLKPGDHVKLDGPFGFFRFNPSHFLYRKFLFVATGTGISPFHSFIKTYPELDYKIIHGVRFAYEAYDHNHFNKENITLCTTGDQHGDFKGRVTQLFKKLIID